MSTLATGNTSTWTPHSGRHWQILPSGWAEKVRTRRDVSGCSMAARGRGEDSPVFCSVVSDSVTLWMEARQTLSTFCVNLRERGWVGQLETGGEECLLQGCFCTLRVCKGVWSHSLDVAKVYHWSIQSLGWISTKRYLSSSSFFPPTLISLSQTLVKAVFKFAASFPISNRIKSLGKEKMKKFFLLLYYLFSVFLYSILGGSFLLVKSAGISCTQWMLNA